MNIVNFCKRMIKYLWCNKNLFGKVFFQSMGVLSSFVTIVCSVCTSTLNNAYWFIIVCLIISVGYAIWSIRPKKEIKVRIKPNLKVRVAEGDIFTCPKGSFVVIPVNNFFDTQLKNDVVGKGTLHGMFIKHYLSRQGNTIEKLENEINDAIREQRLQKAGTYPNRKFVDSKKCDAYPLGSVIRIMVDGVVYCLVVATEFDEDNHVITQPEMFTMMLMRLLKNIDKYCSARPVYMPIIGTGQTGLDLSKQDILVHLLHCFGLINHYVAVKGTNILVYSGDMKEISLNQVENAINKLIG